MTAQILDLSVEFGAGILVLYASSVGDWFGLACCHILSIKKTLLSSILYPGHWFTVQNLFPEG